MSTIPVPSARFVYRAGAAAFGGRITSPAYEEVPGEAASFLSPDGGHASSSINAFSFGGFLRAANAHSEVVGNPYLKEVSGRQLCYHRTLATVTLNDLDIDGVVTADKVVARLVSEQPCDPAASGAAAPVLSMDSNGSYFVNLRIHGQPVSPRPHATTAGDRKSLGAARGFRNPYAKQVANGSRVCYSIFDDASLPQDLSGATCHSGWRIVIPDFGRLYLGERHASDDQHMLTMLRAELGSPREGVLSMAAVEGDGHFP